MNCLPKIGIRPVIDGRRNGIRESLEEQTMAMAKAAEKLITENLRHSGGQAIECVIADTTIGGVAEAAQCNEKFATENVQISLTVTPCWCYGTETFDDDPVRIKAVWGFNGTERPGAVYLAAVLAAHNQKGLPAFGIYGRNVQDSTDTSIPEDVKEKILLFAKAALAVATMRGRSYLSIGSVSMGIGGSIVDDSFFQKYLGMRNEYVDMSEIIRRLNNEIYDKEEFEKALIWTKDNCTEGVDYNDKKQDRREKNSQWKTVVKMTLIIRDLMKGNPQLAQKGFIEESTGHNAIAAGFQGQRQWTDFMPNGDFSEAILNSSFDWNGIREAFVLATENDSLNGATMLFSHLLTDTAQVFADVRTYWSPDTVKRVTGHTLIGKAKDGIIHLINSGAAALDATGRQQINGESALKPFWDITEDEVKSCLENVKWAPANRGYFRGGGYSSCFSTYGEMPVTMSRINIVAGLGPVLQIAEGYTASLPEDIEKILWDRTDPAWPTTWFAPILTGSGAFTDVYSVMNNWGANHGSFSYGHIGDKLITLAAMLRIPVNMHNVPKDRIFRPSAWAAFGTEQLESADYSACEVYGPLYK